MGASSFTKSVANIVYEKFAGNIGKMLLWTGSIGWALSSAAQIFAIVKNDKIPRDQKKFLIPQELFDAVINILAYVAITKSFTKIGDKLVESGRLANSKIRTFLKVTNRETQICKKGFNIANLDEVKKETDKDFAKDYYKFADGISFISTTIGSIISCNIVTPVLRNKIATNRQKKSLHDDQMKNNLMLPTSPVLPAQNRMNINDYRAKVAKTAPASVISGGGMKI